MIRFLRSSSAILAVLILALLAQIPHAAYVFLHRGESFIWWDYVFAIGFAVALEFAVLVFVLNSCLIESYFFAVVSVAMNLCYYHMKGVTLFSLDAIDAWIIAFALPAAIARYSHLAAHKFAGETVEDFSFATMKAACKAWWRKWRKAPPVVVDAETMAIALPLHESQPETVLSSYESMAQEMKAQGLHYKDAARRLFDAGCKEGAQLARLLDKSESTISRLKLAQSR